LSAELKAATYEYQLSRTEGSDLEIVRQTALVLEDVLKTVTGEIPKYPYQPRKAVAKGQPGLEQKRSLSLALKNKNIQIKQRTQPGEYKSNLHKQKEEEKLKLEADERNEKERKDMERIKRAIMLKKKLADGTAVTREINSNLSGAQSEKAKASGKLLTGGSEAGDDQLTQALQSIKVLNPATDKAVDKKKLTQIRAQQLKLSEAEREAKK